MYPKVTHILLVIATLIAMEINEIEADRDLDFHCPDTVRSMIQDGCRHLQRVLKQRAAEVRKKKLEHEQIMSERRKRDYNDVMDQLNAIQNDTNNFNGVDDGDYDDDSANFSVQFLDSESHENFMKGHRLYNARRSNYPDGAHLILNHRSAKMLRDYDTKYKIEPRSIGYRSVDGKLVKDHTNRHRRYTTRHEFVERLAACCQSDTRCLVAFCLATP